MCSLEDYNLKLYYMLNFKTMSVAVWTWKTDQYFKKTILREKHDIQFKSRLQGETSEANSWHLLRCLSPRLTPQGAVGMSISSPVQWNCLLITDPVTSVTMEQLQTGPPAEFLSEAQLQTVSLKSFLYSSFCSRLNSCFYRSIMEFLSFEAALLGMCLHFSKMHCRLPATFLGTGLRDWDLGSTGLLNALRLVSRSRHYLVRPGGVLNSFKDAAGGRCPSQCPIRRGPGQWDLSHGWPVVAQWGKGVLHSRQMSLFYVVLYSDIIPRKYTM